MFVSPLGCCHGKSTSDKKNSYNNTGERAIYPAVKFQTKLSQKTADHVSCTWTQLLAELSYKSEIML